MNMAVYHTRAFGKETRAAAHSPAQRRENNAPSAIFENNRPQAAGQGQLHSIIQNKKQTHATDSSPGNPQNVNMQDQTLRLHNTSEVIQRAGHADVMVYSAERVYKRVENTEASIYTIFKKRQEGGSTDGIRALPYIFEVHKPRSITLDRLTNQGVLQPREKISKFLREAEKNGESIIEIENVKGADADLIDFKIGTITAEENELLRHGHVAPKKIKKKIEKHKTMDEKSGSEKYGIRDEDEWKKKYTKMKAYTTRIDNTMGRLLRTRQPIQEESTTDQCLLEIYKFIADEANPVFVGASLLYEQTPNAGDGRVRLIDLAHPIYKRDPMYDKVRYGMVLGLFNLWNILQGHPLQDKIE